MFMDCRPSLVNIKWIYDESSKYLLLIALTLNQALLLFKLLNDTIFSLLGPFDPFKDHIALSARTIFIVAKYHYKQTLNT